MTLADQASTEVFDVLIEELSNGYQEKQWSPCVARTLVHHYQTDERGIITNANLIVATQNNAARIAMSVDRAAKGVIKNGNVDDGVLNLVEMAFRAYDPCHGCATHALQGPMSLVARVFDPQGNLIREFQRD